MNNDKNILICKCINFYSNKDEAAFFEWLKKIPSITKFDGRHDELYLHIQNNKIDNADLIELISLFQRYKIKNMNQLAVFLNSTNKEWFQENKKAYWYKKVFESKN